MSAPRVAAAGISLLLLAGACAQQPDAPARPRPAPSATDAVEEPTTAPRPEPGARRPRGPVAPVTRVVDGDTIEVSLRGRPEKVRLIGIDTPETVHPFEPVECFGKEASDFTRRHLEGRRVLLEFDVERRDRYRRLLAYVWRSEELFNLTLVARGYAQVTTFPPNVRYVYRFLRAQRRAREGGRGLWAGCPPG